MMQVAAPPEINPLVDAIFDALPEPDGFEFEVHEGHYLWPVFGQDSWRLMMTDKRTKERIPVFFPGNTIHFLTNAIKTANEEIVKAVPKSL